MTRKRLMQTTHSPPSREVVRKNKVLAVVLAIFMGSSVWLYTYNQDKRKFWVGFAITQFVVAVAIVVAVALVIRLGNLESAPPADVRQFLGGGGPWIAFSILGLGTVILGLVAWAFIDRIAKPTAWYERYPKAPLSKTLAIVFAIFLVYFSWLYTYERDKTKFWIGFGANFFTSALANSSEIVAVDFFAGSIAVGIWIWVIVDVAIKNSAWYANYPSYRANVPPANNIDPSGTAY